MPWRRTSSPYAILVSETMLQQTRVETVIPYYHRFLDAFPTPKALADADEQHVLKLWEGLGYYRRARNLQRAMQIIRDHHAGSIPEDIEAIRSLPGVGAYTAGAVMSIAFNRPYAAVDGNVLRVMARYLGIVDPVDQTPTKRAIEASVQSAIEHSEPRLFTQALMELGAMICVPRKPQCLVCPVASGCAAFASGQAAELPVKTPKKARRVVTVVALWIERNGELLVEQRAADGLLANMWQLPAIESTAPIAMEQTSEVLRLARARLNQYRTVDGGVDAGLPMSDEWAGEGGTMIHESPTDFVLMTSERHVFTHLEWNVIVVRPVGYHNLPIEDLPPNARMVPVEDLRSLVWPKVYSTILQRLARFETGN